MVAVGGFLLSQFMPVNPILLLDVNKFIYVKNILHSGVINKNDFVHSEKTDLKWSWGSCAGMYSLAIQRTLCMYKALGGLSPGACSHHCLIKVNGRKRSHL